MVRVLLILAVLLPCAFALGRWSSAEDESADPEATPVRAQRYRIVWADSALDLTHGGGRWVDEIFFPDFKLAATVVQETEYREGEDPPFVVRTRLYMAPAERPRTDLVGFHAPETDAAAAVTDIEVPAELARAVRAFGELAERYRREGLRLGDALTAALDLKPSVPAVRGPSPETPARDG